MPELTLVIPGEPIAQPRAKATTFGGHARMYTPSRNGIHAYKAAVRLAAAASYHGAPLDCPVRIDCMFVFARPKRLQWKKRPMPREPHTTKPDRDNCDKAVLDALTGCVLADDKRAYGGIIEKWYADGSEQPHTTIVVRWCDNHEHERET